jgi:hypothetical protein
MRLLKDGLNATDPETVPTKFPVPPLGLVWLTVSVNSTPAGKAWRAPGVQDTHWVTNEPKAMSEPDVKVADPTGANDIVKPSNVQVDGVHPPPLKAPVVEKVTVCAVAGSEPNATAALPITIARAIRNIVMSPSPSTDTRPRRYVVVVRQMAVGPEQSWVTIQAETR